MKKFVIFAYEGTLVDMKAAFGKHNEILFLYEPHFTLLKKFFGRQTCFLKTLKLLFSRLLPHISNLTHPFTHSPIAARLPHSF